MPARAARRSIVRSSATATRAGRRASTRTRSSRSAHRVPRPTERALTRAAEGARHACRPTSAATRARVQRAKTKLEAALDERRDGAARAATGDGPRPRPHDARRAARWRGAMHPVTLVIDEIVDIFRELGFTVALGPESGDRVVQLRRANFPPDHPAMDMHDTLYLGDGALLRTHTSPVQMRTLQSYAPPIRILAPGTVLPPRFFDASHAPVFAQIEGLAVDEGISFVDLKATLTHFAQPLLRRRRRRASVRATSRSPSRRRRWTCECRLCGGSGCPACKGTGWMEILGSGMVHPAVLEAAGVDSERYTGWAFGMGPAASRCALRHSRHPPALRFRRALPGAARAMNVSVDWLRRVPRRDAHRAAQLRDLLTARCATVDEHRSRCAPTWRRSSSARVVEEARRIRTPTTCGSRRWTRHAASCSTSCAARRT